VSCGRSVRARRLRGSGRRRGRERGADMREDEGNRHARVPKRGAPVQRPEHVAIELLPVRVPRRGEVDWNRLLSLQEQGSLPCGPRWQRGHRLHVRRERRAHRGRAGATKRENPVMLVRRRPSVRAVLQDAAEHLRDDQHEEGWKRRQPFRARQPWTGFRRGPSGVRDADHRICGVP